MPKPAFIAQGDVHLAPRIWGKLQSVVGDAQLGFETLVNTALEWHLPLVLVGDVFDTVSPDPDTVAVFRAGMERLYSERVPVYAIQGNHDKRDVPWPGALHRWPVSIGDGREVSVNGVNVVGFDYDLKESIHQRLMELGDRESLPDVLLLHQAARQALKFEGRWNCDLDLVPEGIPLVVLGDIHAQWEKQIRKDCRALYTGATHARNDTEIGSKSMLVVNDDLSTERLELPVRPILVHKVYAKHQLQEVREWTEGLADPVLPPLIKLKYSADVADDVTKFVADYGASILVSAQSTGEAPGLELELEDHAEKQELIDIRGIIADVVNAEVNPGVYELVIALAMSSDDISEVIAHHRQLIKESNG